MTNFNNQDFRDRAANPNQTNASNQAELSDGLTQRSAAHNQATYQDGYVQGRYTEQRNSANQRAAEEEGTANGLIFGLLLAALAGLGLGTYFYLTGQNRTPQVAPTVTNPAPTTSPSPQVRERIIERDRVVPVPQQAPTQPQVNITVPNSTPESRAVQPAPQPQTAPQTAPTTGQPGATQSGTTNQTGGQ